MVIILAAFLGGQSVLTEIDRRSLDTVARVEAQRPRTRAPAPAPRAPQVRRAAAGGGLDFAQITTICRASGTQDNPGQFLSRISSAYALSATQATSLRSSCAAYLAGRSDARRYGN